MADLGLRILVAGGGEIMDTMPEHEAVAIIRKWREGGLPAFLGRDSILADGSGRQWTWSVRTSDVVSMHTYHVVVQQQGPVPGSIFGPSRLPPGASGFN